MKFVQKFVGKNRVKAARQELAKNPSPMNYAQLARECATAGMVREALRVCEEGLQSYPGSSELKRMVQRATRIERDERLRELKRELAEAPRPALWREMCEILLKTGQIARAEQYAADWFKQTEDVEARLAYSHALIERYLTDRGRETGRRAFSALDEVMKHLPRDPRAWKLRLKLCSSIGAWREARRCAAQLLGLEPGDPALEARFRSLDSMADGSPSIDDALLAVERTGHLANEKANADAGAGSADVRPALRRLAADPGVHAAFYVRGGTALVQGAKGATAERAARTVRTILQSSRTAARRLGLGQVAKIQIEGGFGTLAVAPGEMDAGALWCKGTLSYENERGLIDIAGLDAPMSEVHG